MADRYWVGGSGTWNSTSTTNWSATSGGAGGASAPTSADDVFFNASSGTGTVTSGTGIVCRNWNIQTTNISFASVTATVAVWGTISPTVTPVGVSSVSLNLFNNSGAFSTLSFGGATWNMVTIQAGTTSGYTLVSAMTLNNSLSLVSGGLNTNGFTVTVSDFQSNTGNTRILTLGASTFVCTVSSSSAFSFGSTANLTFNSNTSTIQLSGLDTTFNGGGQVFNNVSFTSTATSTASFTSIQGGNAYSQLTLTAPAANSVKGFTFSSTQQISTLVASGASATRRIFLRSDTLGTARNLNVTTWSTISDIDFRDITMNTSRSGTRLGNCGGNTNITFPAAKTVYWNLTGTQDWAATGWATTAGGVPAVNNFPLAQDIATFTDTGALTTVTTGSNIWNLGTVDMSPRTTAGTVGISNSNIYGDLLYGTGITPGGGATFLTFLGRSVNQGIVCAGKTLIDRLLIQAIGSTVQLVDAFTSSASSGAISVSNGTFNTGNFNITISASNGQFNTSGAATKALTFGSSLITIAGTGGFSIGNATGTTVTANTATVSLTSASTKTFAGAGLNFNGLTINQGGAGLLSITGSNTFGNITNTYNATGATTIRFTAGTTTTFSNWNASGAATRLLTISSSSASAATVSKSSGVVSADYLSISNSTATGGATWYAGANSTNGGGNTGWIFSAAPSATANFLMFFM